MLMVLQGKTPDTRSLVFPNALQQRGRLISQIVFFGVGALERGASRELRVLS